MDPEQPRRYNFRRRNPTPVIYTDSSPENSPDNSREPSPAASPVASPEVAWEASPGASPADSPEASPEASPEPSPAASPVDYSPEASPEASPEPSPGPSTQPSIQYAAGARARTATQPKRAKKAKSPAAKPQGVTKAIRPTRTARGKARAKASPAEKDEPIMMGGRHSLAKERVVNWQHDGSRIDNPENAPEKWDPNEHDIDENDIDGNIERCRLRIKENILPKMFETILEGYMKRKAEKDAIIAAAPGLPWKVARRLDDLRAIVEDLAENDPQQQMVNAQAVIAAYISGDLNWKRGTCTFWSYGKLVWGPGKFDWETFNTVNKEHQGHKSFWVEECKSGGETLCATWTQAAYNGVGQHNLRITLKAPNHPNPFITHTWDFIDDTGASSMSVFARDIEILEQAAGVQIQAFGYDRVSTPTGRATMPAYHLLARLEASDGHMAPWTDIKALVMPGEPSDKLIRLSGIWPRHLLYFADVPDNRSILYISDDKKELVRALPDTDVTQAIAPYWNTLTPMSDDEMDTTDD